MDVWMNKTSLENGQRSWDLSWVDIRAWLGQQTGHPHLPKPHLGDTREQTWPSSSPTRASQVPGSLPPPHCRSHLIFPLPGRHFYLSHPYTKKYDFFNSRPQSTPLPLSTAALLLWEHLVYLLSTLSILYFVRLCLHFHHSSPGDAFWEGAWLDSPTVPRTEPSRVTK